MLEFVGFFWTVLVGVFSEMPWWMYVGAVVVLVAKPAGKALRRFWKGY